MEKITDKSTLIITFDGAAAETIQQAIIAEIIKIPL